MNDGARAGTSLDATLARVVYAAGSGMLFFLIRWVEFTVVFFFRDASCFLLAAQINFPHAPYRRSQTYNLSIKTTDIAGHSRMWLRALSVFFAAALLPCPKRNKRFAQIPYPAPQLAPPSYSPHCPGWHKKMQSPGTSGRLWPCPTLTPAEQTPYGVQPAQAQKSPPRAPPTGVNPSRSGDHGRQTRHGPPYKWRPP